MYYRSLTVSRYSLVAPARCRWNSRFSIPNRSRCPTRRLDGLTDQGVGNGSFRLPDSLAAGAYTLVARGLDDVFPEERLAFEVIGRATPHFQTETKFARDGYGPGDDVAAELLLKRPDGKPAAGVSLQVAAKVDDQVIFQKIAKADEGGRLRVEFALPRQLHPGRGQLIVAVEDGDRSDTITEAIPLRTGTLHVAFFPEGGVLAAGIENRVYFAARDAAGRPLAVRGEIVDGKGASVARVEAARGGLGVFSITPDAAQSYRLKIISPAGGSDSPLLPRATAEQKIAIATGRGVFAPGAPLEVKVRAAKDRLPLVITARLRGMLVGQRMLVTSSPDRRAKPIEVSIPLDDQVAGVIRLTVYDYTKSPPQVLAERFVYRQPRRLVVRAAEGTKPGGEISLSIQNEKGRPAAAALGLTVFRGGKDKTSPPGRFGTDLLHALLSDGDLQNPAALEGVDLDLSDADAETTLDLVLGCQGPLAAGKPADARPAQAIVGWDQLAPGDAGPP